MTTPYAPLLLEPDPTALYGIPEPNSPYSTPPVAARVTAVASRAEYPSYVTESNGTDTGANVRIRHLSGIALQRIKVRYGNVADLTNQEGDGPNQISLRAAIEYPAGTFWPVYFKGLRDVTLDPGAQVDSDWIDLVSPIPINTAFYSRTFVTCTSGGKWPTTVQLSATYGEAGSSGTTQTDQTTSGTITGTTPGLGPLAIISDAVPSSQATIAVFGDSITVGYKDTNNNQGWVARALEGVVPYERLAIWGETAQSAAGAATIKRRLSLAAGANVAVIAYGTNDLNAGTGLAATEGYLTTLAAALAARGMAVYAATLPPRTTSTDSWVTTSGQTPVASEPIRQQLNAWIRSNPAPFTGHLEIADQVETARNSGIWKPNHTSDGIHGSAVGYAAIAAQANIAATLQP